MQSTDKPMSAPRRQANRFLWQALRGSLYISLFVAEVDVSLYGWVAIGGEGSNVRLGLLVGRRSWLNQHLEIEKRSKYLNMIIQHAIQGRVCF